MAKQVQAITYICVFMDSKIEREVEYYRERKLRKLNEQIEEEKDRRIRREEASKFKDKSNDRDAGESVKVDIKSASSKGKVKIEKIERSQTPNRS